MIAIFRHALRNLRGQILGWGIPLGLLALAMGSFYDGVLDQREQLEELLKAYPPEMMAFFGDMTTFVTPAGYLSAEYFAYMPIILGIFAVLAGSGLLVSDEEQGRLDLLLAHPISRAALFAGRLLALLVATAGILTLMWVGLVVSTGQTAMGLSAGELLLPFLTLFAVLLFFASLALLLSLLLPSRRLAAMVAGLLLVGSFFLTVLARINSDLEPLARLSPLRYYQSGEAINGFNLSWFGGLLGAAALFTLLAWQLFERRDIRVGGEGGWRVSMARWGRAA